MGDEDTSGLDAEDTIVLSAEDMNQILEKTPGNEKAEEEEDESS